MDQYITYYSSEFHDSSDPRNTATSNGSGSSTSPTPHQPPSNPITLNWTPTPSGPPDLEEPNSLWVFEDGYLRDPGFDLAALSANLNNLHTLPPRTSPASMVFGPDGVWTDPSPPVSAVRTKPLPPVTPDFDTSGPGGHWGDYSPGGGISYHQPTEQWADASVQRADASTSLAVAKPNNTENNNQSESSSPVVSSPEGGYGRRRTAQEISQRLAQICRALNISSTEPEFQTLRKIIERLGGTVPAISEPTSWITRTERTRRKRRERRAYYEELHRLVGPPVNKFVYLRVLDSVLARVTARDGGETPGYEPYHVFRLQT